MEKQNKSQTFDMRFKIYDIIYTIFMFLYTDILFNHYITINMFITLEK